MSNDIDKLYEKIDELEIAMMTTRRQDGHLVSRAMANQKHAPGADLWFVTVEGSGEAGGPRARPARERRLLQGPDARVGVGCRHGKDLAGPRAHPSSLRRGLARVVRERGDPRHGTPDDPRMVLVGVDVHSAIIPRGEQAPARRPVRSREGVGDWQRAGHRRDARGRTGCSHPAGSLRTRNPAIEPEPGTRTRNPEPAERGATQRENASGWMVLPRISTTSPTRGPAMLMR